MDQMKKVAMLALGLMVAPVAAQAQSGSATVNATATILAFLDVQSVSPVAFGNIAAGAAATLTPGTTPPSGSLGVVRINHNSNVSVTATPPAGLTLVGGSGSEPTLPVTFSCGYSATAGGALEGAAAACNSLPNRTGNGNGTTRTSYVQVGGSIAAAATTNRIPGTYSGSLVFTVVAVY
jgi:hypothetical protein